MKPDGTGFFSTAYGKFASLDGNRVTGSKNEFGSEGRECTCTTWSYLFRHRSTVKNMEGCLEKDGKTYFVHKTMRYFRNDGRRSVQSREVPTVSGLVFIKGDPCDIQSYLNEHFPDTYLCKDCSTGKVARIPDSQMQPFMRITDISPERIRFLLHPYHYYARNRILLRITTGELAGLEGYIIRIDRDRRLVMNVGGLSVAISGVHAERFEEVEQSGTSVTGDNLFYQRNLQERQVLIDRYFHPVETDHDVAAQAENIDYLLRYVSAELAKGRMKTGEAWSTYAFIIEEIGYYYAPLVEKFKERLNPIMAAGSRILAEMETTITGTTSDTIDRSRYEADLQRIMSQYGYLFLFSQNQEHDKGQVE